METNNQVVEVLKYIGEQFGIAADWTADNIMPYIQDLIIRIAQYEFFSSMVLAIVGFLIAIVLFIFLIKLISNGQKMYDEYDEFTCIGIWTLGFFFLVGAPLAFGLACGELNDVMQAKFLPEVTALEYVQGFTQTPNDN
jgi:hypothetical protein